MNFALTEYDGLTPWRFDSENHPLSTLASPQNSARSVLQTALMYA